MFSPSWRDQTAGRRIAAALYAVAGLGSVIFGAIYLLRDEFMPYHQAAMDRSWQDLGLETQTLFLALLDVAGACWAVAGLLVLVMIAWPFRRGERWARLIIPAALCLLYAPILNATLQVLTKTPGNPPWYGAAFALTITAAALACDRPWRPGRASRSPSSGAMPGTRSAPENAQ